MLNLSQQEYVSRIDELNQALIHAWEQDQRVKALKIAIQVGVMYSRMYNTPIPHPTIVFGNKRETIVFGNKRGNIVFGNKRGTIGFGNKRGTIVFGNKRGTVVFGNKRGTIVFGNKRRKK